jgi:fibronectin-binding autotransporter adhesin
MKTVREFIRRTFFDLLRTLNPIRCRVWFTLACAATVCLPAQGAILSWSGGGGANAYWNNSANWGYAGTPQNYDTLIFPAGQPNQINTNNIANLNLNQIIFAGAGGGYSIYGNAFMITNGLIATNTAGANTINNNLTLSNLNLTILVSNGVSLSLAGSLGGSVFVTNVAKIGLGTLIYSGSTANTYTNLTTVKEGELDLAKSGNVAAIAPWGAGLMIGGGIGTATVRYQGNNQIWSVVTPIILNGAGVLDLNGYSDTASPIALYGGQITTGTGVLTVSGTVIIGGDSTVSGNIALSSTLIFTNASQYADLSMSARISGSYGVTKTGAGIVYLSASNSYTGLTVVQQGWLWAQNGRGLGTTNSGTVVSNGASLVLNGNIGITNEALTLNGPGVSGWGALDVENDTNTWSGPVTNNADSTLDAFYSGSSLHIDGPISGAGGLELFGSGSHYFEGTIANTYAGTTTVDAGTTLFPNKPFVYNGTIPQNLIINGTVRLVSGNQITNTSDVTVNSGGLLDQAGGYEDIDALSGSGNVSLNGGYLIMGVNDGSSTFSGVISGTNDLWKAGTGTITLAGATANTYTGTTFMGLGTLVLNKSVANGTIPGNLRFLYQGTVRLGTSEQIADTASITFQNNGTLDLNNYNETIGTNVTFSGGTIQTGSGTLTLSPNSHISLQGAYTSYVTGNLNIGAGTLTLEGPLAPSWLYVYANVTGSAAIVQNGLLSTYWSGANTYTGNYTANIESVVVLANSLALGNPNNTMTINERSLLALTGNINITNQSLTINTTNFYRGLYVYGPATNSWRANFTLGWIGKIDSDTNCALNLIGPIGGSGGFTKIGPGKLTLSGSTANSYSGLTTVNEGELDLNKTPLASAIPPYGAGLVVGDGTGTDMVRCLNASQFWSIVTPVTINSSGVLDLNGYNDEVAPLTLNGGQITTGAGQLTVYGTVTVLPAAAPALISGNVLLDHSVVITNSDTSSSLNVQATISGSYGITKAGTGTTYLQASNSYTGLTVVQQGWLYIANTWALGTADSGTVVSNGASLVLASSFGITNEALTLNGPGTGAGWGALDSETTGTNIWAGPVTLNADSTIDTWMPGCVLRIVGPISGAGGLNQFGAWTGGGTLYLEGASANTYAGTTTVTNSTLVLNKSVSNGAIPHNAVIYGTLRLGASQQIAETADVLVNAGGLFDLGAYSEYIDTLRGPGTVNFGTGGWIYLGVNNGSSTFDGSFTGTGYASGFTVGKTGSGTFTMTGNNTFSAGATHLFDGKMVINGSQPQSTVIVDSGATLGGSGTVGTIIASGIISPGTSPGLLTSSNVTFAASGTLTVDLNGVTPGVGYDQLNVRGTNSLANATLVVNPAPALPANIGDQFIILNNDGADSITGTFNGLANGAQFSAGGYTFRINYTGSTGNDVVLTLWGVPDKTVTLNAVDRGWYDDTGYHVPSNGNYLAGRLGSRTYNDWFVFNVPVFTNAIVQAELIINCFTNTSPYPQETYLLRQVTNAIATLEAGGTGLTNIYNDLGEGGIYAIRNVYVAESGEKAIIPLNVTFMNDAAAASGSQMALGGSVANLDPTNTRCVFRNSTGAVASDVQLRLTFGTAMTITNGTRSGRYDSFGNQPAGMWNYTVGNASSNTTRDYFVFNMPVLSGQLVNAQLLLNSYTNVSPSGFETYQLYDVTTPIVTLTNGASGATNIYADLGGGALYGGRDVYVSESGLKISLPLNSVFLAAAQANSGSRIALGGAITSLGPTPSNEYLFGFSSVATPSDFQLWLGFLAAPMTSPAFVGGTPTYLGNNRFQLVLSGTTGTTNEIQASFDFQNWDFIQDVGMTSTTATFYYTNTAFPYRFFRARLLP